MATIIESDTLIHTERSFKLSAGPGAGKTHWLTLHIKNVIANGKRLETARRIACISYTNVGADTVSDRLPNHSSIVDVSTIHSFLFANVGSSRARFSIFMARDDGVLPIFCAKSITGFSQ